MYKKHKFNDMYAIIFVILTLNRCEREYIKIVLSFVTHMHNDAALNYVQATFFRPPAIDRCRSVHLLITFMQSNLFLILIVKLPSRFIFIFG